MPKDAILVDPAGAASTLQRECRIDFADTVDFSRDQKVTDVGTVTHRCRSRLLQYWFDEGGAVDREF